MHIHISNTTTLPDDLGTQHPVASLPYHHLLHIARAGSPYPRGIAQTELLRRHLGLLCSRPTPDLFPPVDRQTSSALWRSGPARDLATSLHFHPSTIPALVL